MQAQSECGLAKTRKNSRLKKKKILTTDQASCLGLTIHYLILCSQGTHGEVSISCPFQGEGTKSWIKIEPQITQALTGRVGI